MFEFLIPVLALSLPVLVIVALAVFFNRRLSGSCGGVGADGKCSRCGIPAAEMPNGPGRSC